MYKLFILCSFLITTNALRTTNPLLYKDFSRQVDGKRVEKPSSIIKRMGVWLDHNRITDYSIDTTFTPEGIDILHLSYFGRPLIQTHRIWYNSDYVVENVTDEIIEYDTVNYDTKAKKQSIEHSIGVMIVAITIALFCCCI